MPAFANETAWHAIAASMLPLAIMIALVAIMVLPGVLYALRLHASETDVQNRTKETR